MLPIPKSGPVSYCFRFSSRSGSKNPKLLFSTSSPSIEIFSSYSLPAAFSSASSRSSLNSSYCIHIFSMSFLCIMYLSCMNCSCLLNQSPHFSRAKIASTFHDNDFLDLFSYCHSHNVLFVLFFSSNKQYFVKNI